MESDTLDPINSCIQVPSRTSQQNVQLKSFGKLLAATAIALFVTSASPTTSQNSVRC
jgi:hypothetical protein